MATKHKSHSGAKKRFKKTAKGKLMFKKSCNSHLLTNKGKNHKAFPYGKQLTKVYEKAIKFLLP
jgi:large subunit ribosomal protein L35